MIDLKEALNILEGGDWCALRFITANPLKGSGGTVIEFAKCRIARNRQSEASSSTKSHDISGIRRNPNHNYHFTRNVELPNHQLRKVHPILITHINNHRVV